jgi:hypothetical protein
MEKIDIFVADPADTAPEEDESSASAYGNSSQSHDDDEDDDNAKLNDDALIMDSKQVSARATHVPAERCLIACRAAPQANSLFVLASLAVPGLTPPPLAAAAHPR